MDRRGFLKKIGVVAAASTVPNIINAEKTNKEDFSKDEIIRYGGKWDVIVVGGGPSGCAAAIGAAREGAKVLLIESTGSLGGMGTSGLLNCWCPFTDKDKIIYKGIAEKVFKESKKGVPHIKGNDWVPINTEFLKVVYDDMVVSSGVSVLFFSTMAGVEMKDSNNVEAIIVANKAGLTLYKSKIFIDCTGDGDLAAWAGAKFEKGDDTGSVQKGTLCFALANVDPFEYSLLGTVHTNNKNSPIHKIVASPKYDLIKDNHINDKLAGPGFIMFNAGHVEVDSTDPVSVSSAMMLGRKMAKQLHEGLKEFSPKAFSASYLASTAALLGIREGRRIKCDYTFTLDDWLNRKDFEDGIGRNSYYIDVHKDDSVKYPRYGKGESHGIPFRCLLPVGLNNVMVAGRCISTDNYAYGSLRVMPPSMVTGEAVGTAAGLIYRSNDIDVHNVNIRKLRRRLVEMGQML